MPIKIMLTSAGGLTGTYLIKHFKKTNDCKIIALDSNNLVTASLWADIFYVVPKVNSSEYKNTIEKIILIEKPDVLIPVTSYDVDFFSKNSTLFNVKILTMEYNHHNLLHNKRSCYKFLSSVGIKTPDVYNTNNLIYPCIIKPERSSGSKNTIILENENDYIYWSNKLSNYLIIEYLAGEEYTVDCLFSDAGKCLGANPRKRQKTAGGGVVVSINCISEDVSDIINKLESLSWIRGPVNFQYKHKNGEIVVFDFNTRLASGGLPLTVESGFDIPNVLINVLQNKTIEPWKRTPQIDGLTMIRYYDEVFINI